MLKPLEPFRDQLLVITGLNGVARTRRACARHHAVPDRRRGQAPDRSSSPASRWIRSPPGSSGGTRSSPRSSWRSTDTTSPEPATAATAAPTRTRSRGERRRRRCRWRTTRASSSSACSAKAGRPTPACARRGCAPIAASSIRCSRRRPSLQQRLGADDRVKLTEYLEAVRDIERRIQRAEEQSAQNVACRSSSSRPAFRRPTKSTRS